MYSASISAAYRFIKTWRRGFSGHRPRAALAEIACLNIVNALLMCQTWRADRAAAVLLLPYAGWTVFATALNAEIVRLNPGG